RLNALERPAAGERLVDHRIEAALLAHHARDHVAEERRLGRQILRAFHLAADPVTLELGQNLVQAGAGDVHLIERLHGGEPCGAAPIGFALVPPWRPVPGHAHPTVTRRLSRISASAARAASPPLSPCSGRARAQACASVSTVRMPLPIGRRRATEKSSSARADSCDTISKCNVSPRITQPSATAPSYRLPACAAASTPIPMP